MQSNIRKFNVPHATALVVALGLGLGFGSGKAWAADGITVPENSLRIGLYSVSYNTSAADLSGPFTPSGINLEVQHVNTLYLAYVQRLNARWDMELAAGIPPTTHTIGKGPATLGSVPFDGQEVATAKWFSPSLLFEYKFLDESSSLQPFAGLGLNYTHFYDRVSTAAGDAANGGPTSISLSDSIGPVGTVGVSYRITREIIATTSYSLAQINSKYESNTSGIVRTTDVHFNPKIIVLSVGYSF